MARLQQAVPYMVSSALAADPCGTVLPGCYAADSSGNLWIILLHVSMCMRHHERALLAVRNGRAFSITPGFLPCQLHGSFH